MAILLICNGPLTRYANLRVAHAPGIPGTFSTPPRISDPDMHHDTCVMHVPWCMPGSLTSSFLWSRWRGKRSRYFRRMYNPQFCVSVKRPIRYPFSHSREERNGASPVITPENNGREISKVHCTWSFNIFRPSHNYADIIYKCIFLNKEISIQCLL